MAGPSGVADCNALRRKRTETTQQQDVPEKKARTAAPLVEISPLNVTISTKFLGSNSYGSC